MLLLHKFLNFLINISFAWPICLTSNLTVIAVNEGSEVLPTDLSSQEDPEILEEVCIIAVKHESHLKDMKFQKPSNSKFTTPKNDPYKNSTNIIFLKMKNLNMFQFQIDWKKNIFTNHKI